MSNIFRFLDDINYDLLVPPLGLDFYNMTPKQAKENFEWFVSKIPERMEYCRSKCAYDLKVPIDILNYSPDSLVKIWHWFLKTARMEKTPKKELEQMKDGAKMFGDSFINYERFTVVTQFIMRDVGMYVGQCFIFNYPNLCWHFKTKPKNSVTINQPLITGFRTSYMGKGGEMSFQPIHMVGVQAANFFDKTQKDTDLYNIFMKWVEYIPKTE